ncbi:MAG: hypothetical protein U1C74_24080 [Phenylobacterium sp.]|nr:hypothetical protein [Phenylobacterium sp.]
MRWLAILALLACIWTPGGVRAEEPAPVVTRHTLDIGGNRLTYTAEAGRLAIRDVATGEPLGHVFYTAYRVQPGGASQAGKMAKGAKRPLAFIWNGGPGAPAASLHFEGFGPRRIQDGALVPNADTWLTDADLVFVDPVGTGFSRAVSRDAEKAFTSVIGDVAANVEFIRAWLIRHDAQQAPLIVAGQSYAAGRAGSVAHDLIKRGYDVRGLLLISNTSGLPTYPDQGLISAAMRVGDYAVTALHYRKLPPELGTTPAEARAIAERWAKETYLPALRRRDQLSDSERAAVAADLARHIGLKPSDIDLKTVSITQGGFLGRIADAKPYYLDYRFLEPYRAPPLAAGIRHLRHDLGYLSDLPYLGVEPIEDGFAPFGDYPKPVNASWLHSTVYGATPEQIEAAKAAFAKTGMIGMYRFGPRLPGAAEAVALNPRLKVLVPHGAYDPLGGCSMDAEHGRQLQSPHREAVTFRCYLAGHAIYRDAPARAEFAADFRALARAVANPAP